MAAGNSIDEHAFQRLIIDELVGSAGYVEGLSHLFDPVWAIDEERAVVCVPGAHAGR